MFDKRKKLRKIVETDRYKNSGYRFQEINDGFALQHIQTGYYADLLNSGFEWAYGSRFTKDCIGSTWDVVYEFNSRCPIIKPININKTY